MKKYFITVALFVVSHALSGCGSDTDSQEVEQSLPIEFTSQSGSQTDIFHQKVEVIDTLETYNNFWLSVPSINNFPSFDDTTETLTIILSPNASCGFGPAVQSVDEHESQILITVGRVYTESPETCNPVGYPTYGYSWVKVSKSSKQVGVVFEI